MMEIYYDSVSYNDLLLTISRSFKAKVTDGIMIIPSHIGVGYMKAVTLPNGISILISDCKFREDVMMHRASINHHYYILQLNQAVEAPTLYCTPRDDSFNMLKQMVLLTNADVTSKSFIPANARLLSYR